MSNQIITIDPDIQSGSPVFSGTRVPVKSFIDYISSGATIEAYLEDYPYISSEQLYRLIAMLGEEFLITKETEQNEDPFR